MIQKLLLLILVVSVPMTQQLSRQNVEDVFQGLMAGFLSEAGITHIAPCIGDVQDEADLIIGGIENMLKRTKSGMKEGLAQLAEALDTVPDAMIDCGQVVNDAKKLKFALLQLRSPLRFAYHVGIDLVINGMNIYNEVNQAIADYKDDDFNAMGQQLGLVCGQVLIGYDIRKKLTNSMNTTDVEQLFKGILEGFLSAAQYEHVVPCLGDLYQEGDLVVESVDEFMKSDARSVAKGLALLGQALEKLPNAMTECGEAVTDAKSLIDAFAQFKSPISFVYHVGKDLLVNGVQIYKEIGQSIDDFEHQKFEDMGVQIGKAAEQLLLGQTNKITGTETELIFKGVIEGFLPQEDLNKLLPCIQDLESEASLVYQSVVDFLKKDLSDVKKGLKELGQALESLPKAMEDCSVSVTEIQKIESIIKQFKSPISFAYHVGQDLIVNGVQIFEDIEEAVADYKLEEYEEMGKAIGHGMSKLLIGKDIILAKQPKKFLN